MKKHQMSRNWGTFYKIPDRYSPKLSKSPKTRGGWDTVTAKRRLRKRVTKCQVLFWVGPWNRRKTLGNNQGNLNKVWTVDNKKSTRLTCRSVRRRRLLILLPLLPSAISPPSAPPLPLPAPAGDNVRVNQGKTWLSDYNEVKGMEEQRYWVIAWNASSLWGYSAPREGPAGAWWTGRLQE